MEMALVDFFGVLGSIAGHFRVWGLGVLQCTLKFQV